jgi:hypothetical protein
MVVMHLAWRGGAAPSGLAPALTVATGIAHAVAGAVTGPRLFDRARTRSSAEAGLIGAGTSLLALGIFSPLFACFLFATDITQPAGAFSYVAMPFFIALFAFMAAGWALLLVSAAVGWGLHLITIDPQEAEPL